MIEFSAYRNEVRSVSYNSIKIIYCLIITFVFSTLSDDFKIWENINKINTRIRQYDIQKKSIK